MRRGCLVVALGAAAAAAAVLAAWLAGPRPRFGAPVAADERPTPSPDRRYALTEVTLRGEGGGSARCLLRRPVTVRGPLLPVLLAGGIGTGRRAVTLVEGGHDVLILACDYPWPDPSDLPLARIVWRVPELRRALLATPDALRMAATWLLRRPDADARRLAAVGASLGVPFVSAWAAGDPRVAAAVLAYGGGDLGALFDAALRGRVRSALLRGALARSAAALLAPLEPLRTVGRIAPRPVLLVGSLDDERIPRAAVEALAAAAGEPRRVVWLGGRHMVPRDSALMREIGDTAVTWLARALPPLSSAPPTGHLR